MKVAILSYYSTHVERGVEVWALSLKEALQDECEVTIFHEKREIDRSIPESAGVIRKLFLDHWSRAIFGFTWQILSTLRKDNFDIIIPTNGGWQVALIRIYTFFFRKKMIIVGHAGIGYDDAWNVLWCPDCFVALSTFAKQWARRINPLIRIEMIPNGIWLEKFTKGGQKVSLELKKPIVLSVGSLQAGKRPALTIEAVAQMQNTSLLMLGDGPLVTSLSELGHELLGERFLLKKVPHVEIAKYFHAADVFTLSTWSREAFGIVYLEAMACNLPIVTTDDPIKREIIGDAGIYVDPNNSGEYARALKKALSKDWGRTPRIQAEKYRWERVSAQYSTLFQSLIK